MDGKLSRAILTLAVFVTALLPAASPAKASFEAHRLTLEVGDAITFGGFNYSDYDISIDTTVANPRVSVEFGFKNTPIGVGVEYAMSSNQFDGTWNDGEGTIDIDRQELAVFGRLGSRDGTNLRVGLRRFKYDASDGDFTNAGDHFTKAEATGDMPVGLDVEATFAAGKRFVFSLTVGGTYFIDADYDWSYLKNGVAKSGEATLTAYSGRIRPEISFAFLPDANLRVFLNYMAMVSTWEGTPEGSKSYLGTDIYSAASVGVRYFFQFP